MSNIFMAIKLVSATIQAALYKYFGIKSQKGVTLIEYALIGALVAVALISSLGDLKTAIDSTFDEISAKL